MEIFGGKKIMVTSKLYKQAVDKFGKDNQLLVTVGELAECSSEIAKCLIPQHETDEDALLLEIADVCIMVEQLHIIYGKDRINSAIRYKLDKVKRHING